MSYCLCVWGGIKVNKLEPLFIVQKSCIRILFGKDALLKKYNTCARCRPREKQVLDCAFYEKEHTKPLFLKDGILAVHSLYTYYCFLELLNILKFRQPYSFFELFHFNKPHIRSTRYNSRYINTPTYFSASSNEFTYKAVKTWNYCRTKLDIHDFEIAVNTIRYKLKSLIESIQNAGNPTEWRSQNFCHIPPAL